MAKVRFDTAKAVGNLKADLNKVSRNKKVEKDLGTFLTDRVKLEARRGKPLNDNRKFPSLSKASKAIRNRLSKLNKTHGAFSPKRSNLTFTGQLQDALTFKRKSGGLFELFIKAKRRKNLKVGKGKSKSQPNNKRVDDELRSGVKSQEKGTRKFNLFTGKGLKSDKKISARLKQIYLRFLRRQLRRA